MASRGACTSKTRRNYSHAHLPCVFQDPSCILLEEKQEAGGQIVGPAILYAEPKINNHARDIGYARRLY